MLYWMIRLAFTLIAVVTACCGCDKASGPADQAAISEIRLGFFPNLTHAQAVLGNNSGDFAAAVAPVNFSAHPYNAGPGLIEALVNHQIDIGYVGPGPAINSFARSHGASLRVISGVAADGVVIVARQRSGIISMADLKGRRIATPQFGNTQDISAKHYLTAVLKQSDTNNVQPTANADQPAMMARGSIDAAWAPEPWGSLLIAQTGAVAIGEEKDLWPDRHFSLAVIVTTPEFLAAHADIVQKILQVNHTWTQRLCDAPLKYSGQLETALAALTGKPLPAGVMENAFKSVKFTEDPMSATFEAFGQWSADLGFAKEKPDLGGLIDLSILKKLQAGGH